MDLLWSDPVIGIKGFEPNLRGASFGFGEDVVVETCHRLDIDMIARAHQVRHLAYKEFLLKSAPYGNIAF